MELGSRYYASTPTHMVIIQSDSRLAWLGDMEALPLAGGSGLAGSLPGQPGQPAVVYIKRMHAGTVSAHPAHLTTFNLHLARFGQI